MFDFLFFLMVCFSSFAPLFFIIKDMVTRDFVLFSVTQGSPVVLLPSLPLLVSAFLPEGDSDGVQYTLISRVCRMFWPGQSGHRFPLTPVIGSEMACDPVGVS